VEILEQRIAQHVFVAGVLHHCGNGVKTQLHGGTQTALTHDQLVLRSSSNRTQDRANHDGLEYSNLADRVDELGELLLTEFLTGLLCVRNNVRGGEVCETRSRHGDQFFGDGAIVGEKYVDRAGCGGVIHSGNERADSST
jgi:hypothetical protein